MRIRLCLFVPLVGLAVISACTTASESSAYLEASDSAGVTIIESRRPRWTDGEAWSVSTEPKQTIGVLDGAEEYQLMSVSAAARQSDGDLVVADRGAHTVRLYDDEGSFVDFVSGQRRGRSVRPHSLRLVGFYADSSGSVPADLGRGRTTRL